MSSQESTQPTKSPPVVAPASLATAAPSVNVGGGIGLVQPQTELEMMEDNSDNNGKLVIAQPTNNI